jgi:hypothetical protein
MTTTEINNIAKQTASKLESMGLTNSETQIGFAILRSGNAEKYGFGALVEKYKTPDRIAYEMYDTDALILAGYYGRFLNIG